jgi:hypothetical protein
MRSKPPPRNSEAAILARIIEPDAPTLSVDAARSILALGFRRRDITRMNKLAAKARAGPLKPKENAELDGYLHVGRFLALVQVKARRSLRKRDKAAS